MRLPNLLLYVVPTAYQKAAPLLVLPLLSSVLGPSDFGRAAILTTVFMLAQVLLGLGLDSIVFYSSSRGTLAARQRRTASAAKIALVCPVTIGVAVSSILFAFDFQVAGVAAFDLGISVCAGAIYASAGSFCLSLFRVENRLPKYAGTLVLFTTLQLSLRIVLITDFGWGVRGWAVADLISSVFFYLVCFPTLRRKAKAWTFSYSSTRHVFKMGLPLVPSQFFQWIAQSSDRILVGLIVGGLPVGTYALAAQFGGAGLSMIAEACRYFMRTFSQAHALFGEEKRIYLRNAVSILTVAVSSIAAVVGPGSQLVISFAFADEFESALWLFPGISIAIFLAGLSYVAVDFTSVVYGDTKRIWISSLMGAFVTIGGDILLLPTFGICVVPWVATTSYALALLVLFRLSPALKTDLSPRVSVFIFCSLLLVTSSCICVLFASGYISDLVATGGVIALGLAGSASLAKQASNLASRRETSRGREFASEA